MFFVYAVISILSGVTVVLGRILNAKLTEKIGTVQATLINYVVGIFFSLLMTLLLDRGFYHVRPDSSLPFWTYLGGLLGVAVIITSNYITPRVPAFYLTLLVFLGQLTAGVFIDWRASKEFSYTKLIGSLFVVAGFIYNLRQDKKAVKDQHKNK